MKKFFAVLCILALCLSGFSFAETAETAESPLRVEDGMMQPFATVSDLRAQDYSNENSDILRFCVWVETDYDTDFDGYADLVKVLVQVPRAAVEGKYKAAVIYDPTPYDAGEVSTGSAKVNVPFNYDDFYHACDKRTPIGSITTLEAAGRADPSQWNYTYTRPNMAGQSYMDAQENDYFLARGFAVINACGIGTYGSQGFELCGTRLERDSHKCVVEWLTGDRPAYIGPYEWLSVDASWCNGSVAMTGTSYGGTLPFEVAVTGVKGLKTIVPYSGIASWYSYVNYQGIPILNDPSYTDYLAGCNAGGTFLDSEMMIQDRRYGSWLYQVSQDEAAANGDYAPIWAERDYTRPEDNHINCSALIVQGLHDYNVLPVNADLMVRAFRQAGQAVKLVLHQDGHTALHGMSFGGGVWEDLLNRWFSHYLYGVENGIEESLPAVLAQSNVDGSFVAYDSFDSSGMITAEVTPEAGAAARVTSEGLGLYTNRTVEAMGMLLADNVESFYRDMDAPMRALYTLRVPEGTTLFGTTEVHVRLASDFENLDGLMISAVLLDVADNGESFQAYRFSGGLLNSTVSKDEEGLQEDGRLVWSLRQMDTTAQLVTVAWTDLQNPGMGPDPAEYVIQDPGLEAGVFKDYTFYMVPTVYTVAEGHHLELYLLTWDPYRVFLDENLRTDTTLETKLDDYNYSYEIDPDSLQVLLPVAP